MFVENPLSESDRRMPTPQEADFEAIFVACDPLVELNRIQERVPGRLSYERTATLKKSLDSGQDRKEALSRLTWYCLPQLNAALQEVKGMGIDNQELVQNGLLSLQEIILGWQPKEDQPAKQDHLRFIVVSRFGVITHGWVTQEYGLPLRRFPIVKLYFNSRQLFKEAYGREADEEDFPKIRDLANQQQVSLSEEEREAMIRLRLMKVKRGEVTTVEDALQTVHERYQVKRCEFTDETGELEEEKFEWAIANILPGVFEEVLATLSDKEAIVLKKRFGFEESPQTLEDVGKLIGVGPERTRNIEAKALRKLRHPSRSGRLRDFLR